MAAEGSSSEDTLMTGEVGLWGVVIGEGMDETEIVFRVWL